MIIDTLLFIYLLSSLPLIAATVATITATLWRMQLTVACGTFLTVPCRHDGTLCQISY